MTWRAMIHEDHFDFSFSGLKSAVINRVQRRKEFVPEDLAANLSQFVVFLSKTRRAPKPIL